MERHQLEIGRWYAFREKRGSQDPMLKFKLLDKNGRKGKIKIRLVGGASATIGDLIGSPMPN